MRSHAQPCPKSGKNNILCKLFVQSGNSLAFCIMQYGTSLTSLWRSSTCPTQVSQPKKPKTRYQVKLHHIRKTWTINQPYSLQKAPHARTYLSISHCVLRHFNFRAAPHNLEIQRSLTFDMWAPRACSSYSKDIQASFQPYPDSYWLIKRKSWRALRGRRRCDREENQIRGSGDIEMLVKENTKRERADSCFETWSGTFSLWNWNSRVPGRVAWL